MRARKVTIHNTRRILHVANWYPNPWSELEGNFIRSQIQLFCDEIPGEAVVVQVRHHSSSMAQVFRVNLIGDVPGYFLLISHKAAGRLSALLSTLLLLYVLVRHRFWRFSALHFHIANPLLCHIGIWKNIVRKPILISEHWSAYHYNFYLPKDSTKLEPLRRPFHHQYPLLAVSQALIEDIHSFAQTTQFPAYVIPNVVPLHGASPHTNSVVRLFTVNRWVPIKDPMTMLEGLALAMEAGADFELIIGGGGEMLEQMVDFIKNSSLAPSTQILGWMDKNQIANELTHADGYVFSSRYETFSVGCAEALGAGVPLIGPKIPAIAEYADHSEWEQVRGRSASDWKVALIRFLERFQNNDFNPPRIADRCATLFSPEVLKRKYKTIVDKHIMQ
jgi:glycosyltransferase involved in cell wall biosynthesis